MGLFNKFPYTNFHEVNTDWIINEIKRLVTEWEENHGEITEYYKKFDELKEYVNTKFIEMNITEEVKKQVTELVESGQLDEIISSVVGDSVFERVNKPLVMILGDSYGTGYNSETPTNNWATKLANSMKSLGYEVISKSVGGYGFVSQSNKTFTSLLSEVIDSMTTKQKEKVELVIVGGSYNDRGKSIREGVNSFLNLLNTSCKNCKKVVAVPMGWVWEGHTTGVHASTKLTDIKSINTVWMTTCAEVGMSVIPAYKGMWAVDSFSSDGVHPSDKGQTRIAQIIAGSLYGEQSVNVNKLKETVTVKKLTSDENGTMNVDMHLQYVNDSVIVELEQLTLSNIVRSNVQLNPNQKIQLGTFDTPVTRLYNKVTLPCTVILRGKTNGTSGEGNLFISAPGAIHLESNNISCSLSFINSAKRDYERYDINRILCLNIGRAVFNPLYE